MPRYLIEFERIGRSRGIAPLTVDVTTDDELAIEIERYARPHLRSRDFEAVIDREAGAGWIACGMHSGGDFSVTQVAAPAIDYGPAMTARHVGKGYPFGNRVPKLVRMTRTVTSDFLPGTTISVSDGPPIVALNAATFPAWTNSYGAVAVHTPDGRKLGVKPSEFEVVEWHEFD